MNLILLSYNIVFFILIVLSILGIAFFVFPEGIINHPDYCTVCEWNYEYGELLDYEDSGHGHAGALQEIWDEANYGKKVNLEWYENYRIKYNLTNVYSFNRINYSNPRPVSPNIKFMDEGNISEIVTSRDVGYPHLVYVNPVINGTEYYWHMWEIPEDVDETVEIYNLINVSHHYFVYKRKSYAWHYHYKDADIVDGFVYPDHKNNTLLKWNNYFDVYKNYLDCGGIDLGDDYWM